jgi:hypothetical protein
VNRSRDQFATTARAQHGHRWADDQFLRHTRLVAICVIQNLQEVEGSIDKPQATAE